jgi:Flp pilus assembly protein TadG
MRRHLPSTRSKRRGVAAVEFAAVLPLLLLLLLGIWELGRIIHVQIILNNAARDGARLGAQAYVVNTSGDYTQIKFDTGTPNIKGTVRAHLQAAGITDLTGVVVQFQFVEASNSTPVTPTGSNADPYMGKKNQRFRVRVSIPYDNVRWTSLTLLNPKILTSEAYWQCLVDDPFTLNTTLPGWSP